MKYAVISLAGQQHTVNENDEFVTQKIDKAVGEKLSITDVLMLVDGDKKKYGTPLVAKAVVDVEVVSHGFGDKIRVSTYKAKARQRKTYGHKQPLTTLKVLAIK